MKTRIFFKYSPKRNNLLLCVIENYSPDAKKTTLKNMCKTRSVERHEAYEVFFALFSCIMRALEVMAMNVCLLAFMATQHGAGTQTPRIKRVDLRMPFQVFLLNHLVDGNEMPFRPETP